MLFKKLALFLSGSLEICCNKGILVAFALEELSVVFRVRSSREYSFEVASSRLFIFKVH